MGYRRDSSFELDFEDTDLEGLTVRARSVPVRVYRRLIQLTENGLSLGDPTALGRIDEVIDLFVDGPEEAERGYLVSWDLEDDDGQPVPCTPDEFRDQDKRFQVTVINLWIVGLVTPSGPLRKPSSDGPLLEELPMDSTATSPSLAS